MRGITRQRQPRPHEIARQRQAERPGARLVDDLDLAELQSETLLQLGLEDDRVLVHEPIGIGRPLGPDDRRAIAPERQDRERAGGQEMLFGTTLIVALVLDGAHDP